MPKNSQSGDIPDGTHTWLAIRTLGGTEKDKVAEIFGKEGWRPAQPGVQGFRLRGTCAQGLTLHREASQWPAGAATGPCRTKMKASRVRGATHLRQASRLLFTLCRPPCVPWWAGVAWDTRDGTFPLLNLTGSSDAGGRPTACCDFVVQEGRVHLSFWELRRKWSEFAVHVGLLATRGGRGKRRRWDLTLPWRAQAQLTDARISASSNVTEGVRHTGVCPASVLQGAEAQLSVSVL